MKSRFEYEINGEMGNFWKRRAEENVRNAIIEATDKAEVDEDGAIKWKSNGKYLFDDFCEMLEYGGFEFSRQATKEKREAQTKEFLDEYKSYRSNHEYSDEEMYEMRAAFGEDAEIVDVFTGESIDLSRKKSKASFERD